jgi:hypothetical protein
MNQIFVPLIEGSGRIIPAIETKSPAEIKKFQEKRLQQQLA